MTAHPAGRVPPPGAEPEPVSADELVADAGVARNTMVQLAAQVATLVFTSGLTLYLVRGLGVAKYGVYSLAVSIGGLMLFPAGLGLPLAVGRFLADHRLRPNELRRILRDGLRLQIPAAAVVSLGVFAASGAIADAYGRPALGWPLRWAALAVFGQALFAFLTSVGSSVRQASLGLWMTIAESAVETVAAIALVAGGAGVAGATLGKFMGYAVATVFGVWTAWRLVGGRVRDRGPGPVTWRTLARYAGVMFIVDVTWSAITQIDVLLIGAMLGVAAVGSFGAVLRVLTVLGYLGMAVSAGVAPRLSLAGGDPDIRSFQQALRYLILVQGIVIAPMLVWATPIVHLLLGSGYDNADRIMRALTPFWFIASPASLVTVAVTYLGEARRRVVVMLVTLVIGLVVTYVLIRVVGVLGAAYADDVIEVVYVGAHLWICTVIIDIDLRPVVSSTVKTIIASGAMALVLFVAGTSRLTLVGWLAGGLGGAAVFVGMLLVLGELSLAELRGLTANVRGVLLPRSR